MNWIGTGLSHLGQVRRTNEDAFSVRNHIGLWVIADGMGGHAGGEIASQLAVDTIANFLEPRLIQTTFGGPALSEEESLLIESIQAGQQAILQAAEATPDLRGMGTTVVVLRISSQPVPRLILLHVGDSRGYLLREGTLRKLSVDHSLMERYIREGSLSPEEAEHHPNRHVLTRGLGTRRATPDLSVHLLNPDDQVLLCTDGLTTMLSDTRIAEVWCENHESPRSACHALVAEANARGGQDNITVVVVARKEHASPNE